MEKQTSLRRREIRAPSLPTVCSRDPLLREEPILSPGRTGGVVIKGKKAPGKSKTRQVRGGSRRVKFFYGQGS